MRVLERDDSCAPLPPPPSPRITLSNVLLVCCAISWPTMIGDNTVCADKGRILLRYGIRAITISLKRISLKVKGNIEYGCEWNVFLEGLVKMTEKRIV